MKKLMKIINSPGNFIIRSLETFFKWWGKIVCRFPYPVIFSCLLLSALGGLGWIKFRLEHKANKLWIPNDSLFNTQKEWLDQNFPTKNRLQMLLIKADNILTPSAIKKMFEIHQSIESISANNKTFNDICTRIAIADIFQNKRKRKKREAFVLGNSNKASEDSKLVSENISDSDSEYNYDYDIWGDYAYTDDESEQSNNSSFYDKKHQEIRINFAKYGPKNDSNKVDRESNLPKDIYCHLVDSLNEKCGQQSLLEIWRYDPDLIATSTQQEIIDAINILESSPWFGHKTDFSSLLGGVTRNITGHIISASTAIMFWSVNVPDNSSIIESQGSGVELELGDLTSLQWEAKFVEVSQSHSDQRFEVLPNAVSSYGNESADAIFFDGFMMACGYFLMLAYTCLILGPLKCVENRVLLSFAGIISVILGFIISIGIASLLGYPYTLVHAILPFLCLGIGIDDMFVIIQCLNITKKKMPKDSQISDLISETMAHAGVSITVTSITDVLAFGVGYFTKMPGLQSFCIYASLGLGSIFLLQCTWFIAWLVLDERRIQNHKNGFLPCIVHHTDSKTEKNNNKSEISKSEVNESTDGPIQKFKNVALELKKKVVGAEVCDLFKSTLRCCISSVSYSIIVIGISSCFLGAGSYGLSQINYKFDPLILVPTNSYFTRFLTVNDENFNPLRGYKAHIYIGSFNSSHLENLAWLDSKLEKLVKENIILESYNSWWKDFVDYSDDQIGKKNSWIDLNEETFPNMLSKFLFSKSGSRHQNSFKFESILGCGEPAPKIMVTSLEIEYVAFDGPDEHVPGKSKIDSILLQSQLPDAFSFNKIYLAWETDTIIGRELWRNLGLGVACIFLITFILLANIQVSLMVMMMVGVTLIDIVGFLYLWNVHIDIVSCINIVISVGLCVDYSVHIGHAYIVAHGNRLEKTLRSIETIGPAVFNGGLTTFLALTLCGGSTSHTFITFFKVFVLTVIFGLYHGLVLLPVLLSLFGPVDQSSKNNAIQPGASISNEENVLSQEHKFDPEQEKKNVFEKIKWTSMPPVC